ncbi:hypothetical protein [Streptomyces silvisoli]|uniref:Uncharacterized protein n=1 Tax=Streptomyces silvisoli TaxID=3034235 RepID=A0ABT5ZS03_9ACTN|nr:hypothetical protein [Streptomyces silvisoli]MDF3292416.1 hypothetical protein [Streptomyces silvisoli]
MATRSLIARPTKTGYAGMYVHFDGYPSTRLPLLLAAYQHRFAGDVEAMARHLIDDVDYGWSEIGTDLLDGAPDALRQTLTGGTEYPSRKYTDVINTDGTPAKRQLITQATTGGLDWGYVLHPHGIEVIPLSEEDHGPVVDWNTDPRARFSDSYARWKPGRPIPATIPPRATHPQATPAQPAAAPASTARPSTRR